MGCHYHLLQDQLRWRKGRRAWEALAPDAAVAQLLTLKESCALDVAERGGKDPTFQEIGGLLRMVRQRAEQINVQAVAGLRDVPFLAALLKELDDGQ